MGAIVSSISRTIRDEAGNAQVEAHMLLEFRDASYQPGGEVFDLSTRFRRIEYAHVTPASGALFYIPDVGGDYPATNPLSGRLRLQRSGGSGLVFSEVASGVAVSGTRAWAYIVGY